MRDIYVALETGLRYADRVGQEALDEVVIEFLNRHKVDSIVLRMVKRYGYTQDKLDRIQSIGYKT